MKYRLLDWLVCPICGESLAASGEVGQPPKPSKEVSSESACSTCHAPGGVKAANDRPCASCYGVEVESGALSCRQGHTFPIAVGLPHLAPDLATSRSEAAAISASFSREWGQFQYEDRTWSQSVQDRCELFLKEVGISASELSGKVVLDAGCGNGSLSRGLNQFGCEVVAADVSTSVIAAYQHFAQAGNNRTHFLRANLLRNPFRPESFDVIYSSGVLHHNPNTFEALKAVAKALKPGGRIYIWVYEAIPGIRHKLKGVFRSVVAPLPAPVKNAIMYLWLPQSMARQYLRSLRGGNKPEDQLKWREKMILLMDHYTPQYRWEHTQEEVHGWYRQLGFTDICTTEVREWGFGVAARKPLQTGAPHIHSSADKPVSKPVA